MFVTLKLNTLFFDSDTGVDGPRAGRVAPLTAAGKRILAPLAIILRGDGRNVIIIDKCVSRAGGSNSGRPEATAIYALLPVCTLASGSGVW